MKYLAMPGFTELAVDWPNFDVVGETSSKLSPLHISLQMPQFSRIVLTTEKLGTAKFYTA